jgi:hypothetical protein
MIGNGLNKRRSKEQEKHVKETGECRIESEGAE